VTIEVGLAEVELETSSSGREDDELASTLGVSVTLANESHKVDGDVDAVAQTENVEETGTSGILEVVLSTLLEGVGTEGDIQDTHSGIGNEVPETGLFVATDGVGDVPEEITVYIVETETAAGEHSRVLESDLGVVPQTVITQTHTDGGSPPLTEVEVNGEADVAPTLRSANGRNDGVDTGTDTDEGIVKGLVGLVSTANDLTVLVTIVVLLSGCAHREKEACCSKYSKNSFDTFHD
jgi:hypothetical protein